jgi:hypothetical protein
MFRLLMLSCFAVALLRVDATAQSRGRYRKQAGGYQLHYKPIPPKEYKFESRTPKARSLEPNAVEKLHPVPLVPSARTTAEHQAELDARLLAKSAAAKRQTKAQALWNAAGPYDKTYTPEELLQRIEEEESLPPKERQAARESRERFNQLWAAGRAASELERQQKEAQARYQAWLRQQIAITQQREDYFARQQWIDDQVEINRRTIDYITQPQYWINGRPVYVAPEWYPGQ